MMPFQMCCTEMVFEFDIRRWPVRLVPGGVHVFRRQSSVELQQVRDLHVYRFMCHECRVRLFLHAGDSIVAPGPGASTSCGAK